MGTFDSLIPANNDQILTNRQAKALTRKQTNLELRLADQAMNLSASARAHRHKTETILYTAEEDIISITQMAGTVRASVDGDPMAASLVAPLLQDAVGMVRADLRRTFQ